MKTLLICMIFVTATVHAEWGNYQRLYTSPEKGLLGDILSHCENPKNYYDVDKITWAHEATHAVNHQLYNASSTPSFYVLENHYFSFKECDTTLRYVANNVPRHIQYENFHLYMQTAAASYNHQPSYIVDELTAYMNGLCVAESLNDYPRAKDSFNRAIEMLGYSIILKMSSSKNEGLDEYINWCWQRLDVFKERAEKDKWWTDELDKKWTNLMEFRKKSAKSFL